MRSEFDETEPWTGIESLDVCPRHVKLLRGRAGSVTSSAASSICIVESNMHLRFLKIFCDIVDLGSFSRAAKANGVSQSNASQVVHHLEERMGVQLIDRSKRPFVRDAGRQAVSRRLRA